MDEIEPRKQEKPKRRRNVKPICRETGDHVHYPPKRKTKPTRPPHAPSPGFESLFRVSHKVRYGKCRKNQAPCIGISTYDGCGEFVSTTTGEEDSLNCAACGCHRSFHKEESITDGGTETVLEMLKISPYQYRQIFCSPYGDGGKKKGGDRIGVDRSDGGDLVEEKEVGRVKRLKTKYTAEQTEKMRDYAEKLQWKMSPERRNEVDEFCVEIGVNRKSFRVWMNNHKYTN
ncbi:Zinc-finger homeodomain protein 13 [Cardamine amara subsp. amara]|uniref:Zinc-finger homeodomain protein 13 n=1 Tax=Cardamine amara subsp. amara TaxID=228776 RepID=A0ABD0ZWA4_CARAN